MLKFASKYLHLPEVYNFMDNEDISDMNLFMICASAGGLKNYHSILKERHEMHNKIIHENRVKAENELKEIVAKWLIYKKWNQQERLQFSISRWAEHIKDYRIRSIVRDQRKHPSWLTLELESLIRLGPQAIPLIKNHYQNSKYLDERAIWQTALSAINAEVDSSFYLSLVQTQVSDYRRSNLRYAFPVVFAAKDTKTLKGLNEIYKKEYNEEFKTINRTYNVWVSDAPWSLPYIPIIDPNLPIEDDLPPVEPSKKMVEIDKENNGF